MSFDDVVAFAGIEVPGAHIHLVDVVDTSEDAFDFDIGVVVQEAGTTQSAPSTVHRSTSYQHSHYLLLHATQKRQRMDAAVGRTLVVVAAEGVAQVRAAASCSD